jgi:hypothetical protein
MFGKLTEKGLEYAPNPIRVDGKDIFTTNPIKYGYKPIVIPQEPETDDAHIAVFDGWEETETEIIQRWRIEEAEATEADYQDALKEMGVRI